ncbi:MAG: DUF91 domain-containing protein [Candidatus Dormibacteraeota bacterium]|nr:DUF91 domain-containing protein [Candidatus Dormibacteraeota bacterium]
MPLEMALWRVDGGNPVRLSPQGVPLEQQLEDMLERDPSMLGQRLLLIGRQVPTTHGTFVDLLAVDADGALHVIELKRDRTPRDVVAQSLDYGSWVTTLTHQDVQDIFLKYDSTQAFEQAFSDAFGASPPEDLNTEHRLTIVAAEVDPATERIISYLNTGYGVPINVVFFRYYQDGERSYLGRTWLLDTPIDAGASAPGKRGGGKEPWNGKDWYVNFQVDADGRSWEDGRTYGFVAAGGGAWFSRTLRRLPVGARVFCCIPSQGYVGVGYVIGTAKTFSETTLQVDGREQRLADLPLKGKYFWGTDAERDINEYVVPVRWERTRPQADAVWEKGMFANENSACPLRQKFTLSRLAAVFEVEEG